MTTWISMIARALRRTVPVFALLGGLVVWTTGCGTLSGVPRSSLKAPVISSKAGTFTLPAKCVEEAAVFYEYSKAQRNGWIDSALTCINQTYAVFVANLRKSETAWGIGTGIADLVFKVASSLTPSAGVKANYAAASLLITGTDTIITKEAFLEQTVAALTAAMDANRKKALVPIVAGMQADVSAYSIGLAHEQLLAYQRAGSFIEGLKFVTTIAQANEDLSTQQITDIPLVKAMNAAQTAKRDCLIAVLQGIPQADQAKLFAAYQVIEPGAVNRSTASQLAAEIALKQYLAHDEAFDNRLIAELKNQKLSVPCEGG